MPTTDREDQHMMDVLVYVRDRPGKWWLRTLQGSDRAMVIPIRDGVPIVHEFLIISKADVFHVKEEETKRAS